PLAVGRRLAWERVADLARAQHAAQRAQQHGRVVLDALTERAPAQLRSSDFRILAGQEQKHVESVRPEIPEAAAAGYGGIEHPRRIPRRVSRRRRTVLP